MKRIFYIAFSVLTLFTLSGCILKKSDTPCSECGRENAYLYKIDHIGREVLDEKITVSYCEHCYEVYLEETFGKGALAKAQQNDANFKDVVGSGGYLDELTK